ncbi:methylated-DNA--[protein]-cysteine S-methyltransferase [Microbacterium protaetiae]|uniref:methylated-DNA--[protein]-cysteine S-methyltransferase n=1 Tax=Microbacterium protaetiae TaxID=2509458 RepID=A0A4P6EKP4_9MICO|nr:methylated-DNA--[protein]-cysteine S-methyltransferase [Microbacterium protaetiae]QAY60727.1 methylated-DNA--[protein]-cysteine S-methyltransferase [Microbacterium protaetiae]
MTEATFTVHPSPVGDVLLVSTEVGLVTAHVLHGDERDLDEQLARLTLALRVLPGRDDSAVDEARRQLDDYFDRRRTDFDLTLDWRLVHGFSRTALQTVQHIPYGQTAGYGEVAAMAGIPRAARAVGNACARTPFSVIVPVHRVVRADGSVGGYGGRAEVKRFLLDHERGVGV